MDAVLVFTMGIDATQARDSCSEEGHMDTEKEASATPDGITLAAIYHFLGGSEFVEPNHRGFVGAGPHDVDGNYP